MTRCQCASCFADRIVIGLIVFFAALVIVVAVLS